MHLQWITNPAVNVLHIFQACQSKRCTQPDLQAKFAEPLTELEAALRPAGVDISALVNNTLPVAVRGCHDSLSEATAQALRDDYFKDVSPNGKQKIASAIQAGERLLAVHFPQLADELAIRIGPLRQAWEARGTGLLQATEAFLPCNLAARSCGVVGLIPVTGGAGFAFPADHIVTIEAVLTNSYPELPEVLRLAWLLAQSVFRPQAEWTPAGKIQLLLAVLNAAETVELASCKQATVACALTAWDLVVDDEAADKMSMLLIEIWQASAQTYSNDDAPFQQALATNSQQ